MADTMDIGLWRPCAGVGHDMDAGISTNGERTLLQPLLPHLASRLRCSPASMSCCLSTMRRKPAAVELILRMNAVQRMAIMFQRTARRTMGTWTHSTHLSYDPFRIELFTQDLKAKPVTFNVLRTEDLDKYVKTGVHTGVGAGNLDKNLKSQLSWQGYFHGFGHRLCGCGG